ncbi:MAG: hypothetical protein HY320_00755 [Armatimonadetes bacterium]|nr:hypothetical protein [Armatimonadota bacterium]
MVDAKGTLHLVYFQGRPEAGDVFYARSEPGEEGFSPPIRVNSQPGSAIAVGTIRGAQMALGRDGRVHVAWNGSSRALPKGPLNPAMPKDSSYNGIPMLYARLNDQGSAFEPQRNLMRLTFGLDGGGSVAADDAGNVYVAWHAQDGSGKGEAARRLWLARSQDEGETFFGEVPAYGERTGACPCCSTRIFADSRGTVYTLYRSASTNVDRDMYLLASRDQGERFDGSLIHPWKINACPMSSASFAEGAAGVIAAWETNGQVYYARIDPATLRISTPIPAPGDGQDRKHPAVAVNARGETILVWTEGTGWQRGGSLAWQVFDKDDRPTPERGRMEGGIPAWGLATVCARPKEGFTIIH